MRLGSWMAAAPGILTSRKLRPDNQVLVLLDHVYRRGPPGVPFPLLALCSPSYATEHLVEQAVHLAQRVVEPAAPVSAHHSLYPLLSRSSRIPRRGTHRSCLYLLRPSMPNLLSYQLSQGSGERYSTRWLVRIPGALRSRKASTSSSTPKTS